MAPTSATSASIGDVESVAGCGGVSWARSGTSVRPLVPLVPRFCVAVGVVEHSRKQSSAASSLASSASSSSSSAASTPSSMTVSGSFSSSASTTSENNECPCHESINFRRLFNAFLQTNSSLFKSKCRQLELSGFIFPATMLIGGELPALDVLVSCWTKRILKSPAGYFIRFVGYTSRLELDPVSQTHFPPLAEALTRCVDALYTARSHHVPITVSDIILELVHEFPGVELPSEEILFRSLSALVTSRLLNFDSQAQSYSPAPTGHLFESNEPQQQMMRMRLLQSNIQRPSSSNEILVNDEPRRYRNAQQANANFRRSKSLRLTTNSTNDAKSLPLSPLPSSGQHHQSAEHTQNCTCNDSTNKRQSLLRKLRLKFNTHQQSYPSGVYHANNGQSQESWSTKNVDEQQQHQHQQQQPHYSQFPQRTSARVLTMDSGHCLSNRSSCQCESPYYHQEQQQQQQHHQHHHDRFLGMAGRRTKPEDSSLSFDVGSVASSSKFSDKQLFARLGDRFVCIDSSATNGKQHHSEQDMVLLNGGTTVHDHEHYEDVDRSSEKRSTISSAPIRSSANIRHKVHSSTPTSFNDSLNGGAERFCDSGLGVEHPSTQSTNISSFANDIYAEVVPAHFRQVFPPKPDNHRNKLGVAGSPVAPNSRPSFANPDLNYANSVALVKQQIARAKANFFSAPLTR